MPLYAKLEPQQLLPAGQGPVSLTIQNLDAAADLYLHKEYEFPLRGWVIPKATTLPNFAWDGGRLWISASANNTPYQVLTVEPARGAAQAGGGDGGGGGGGGGGGARGGRTGPPRGARSPD
jgi:hypothetical protein